MSYHLVSLPHWVVNFNKSPLFLFFLDISKAFGLICSENSYGTSPSSFLRSSSSSLNSFPIATKHCKAHLTRTNVTQSYMKHVNLCNYNKGNKINAFSITIVADLSIIWADLLIDWANSSIFV